VRFELAPEEIDALRSLEEELWREETRFDPARMRAVLAPDFFEYGRSGRIYELEDTLAVERQAIHVELPLPAFRARLITPEVAQVTYDSAVTYDGVVQHAHRSSIWSRCNGSWQLRFHQGTPFGGGT